MEEGKRGRERQLARRRDGLSEEKGGGRRKVKRGKDAREWEVT